MHWTCPHCGIIANLQPGDMKHGRAAAMICLAPDDEAINIRYAAVRCPSATCHKFSLGIFCMTRGDPCLVTGKKTAKATAERS
jgi:tRNA-binding EMAP/Myf-like protein